MSPSHITLRTVSYDWQEALLLQRNRAILRVWNGTIPRAQYFFIISYFGFRFASAYNNIPFRRNVVEFFCHKQVSLMRGAAAFVDRGRQTMHRCMGWRQIRLDTVDKIESWQCRIRLCWLWTLSLVRTNWRQSWIRQVVAVDIVAKVEHVQLGWLCRKRVIFAARISAECRTFFWLWLCRQRVPGLSTCGRLCRNRQNRPCRIRLCR